VRLEAVLFDVGNTLLRVPHDPHQRAIAKAAHLGEIPFASYKSSLNQAREEWWASGGSPESQDLPETWIAHIQRALELIGFTGDALHAARLIEDAFLMDGWEVYPEVAETLEEIQAGGYRLGIVSNWPPTLEQTLEMAGLRQYFEVIVVSGVHGYAKPHPSIFKSAVQHLQVSPASALYVGDSLEFDVQGAASIGMPAVLLDPENQVGGEQWSIASLRELLDLLPRASR
jgi:HAD superfamily hydrolase (TIGR01509 family)